jgi:poly(3-hydroxybutyrate) depolymerase
MRHGTAAPHASVLGELHTAFGKLLHDTIDGVTAAVAPPADAPASGAVQVDEPVARRVVPTIVFHGDRDTTVHPCNGDSVIAQVQGRGESWTEALFGLSEPTGRVPGGHTYTRTLHRDADGRTIGEHWLVHGSGHAWSGGSKEGSYTDPLGPDASSEMLRFFAEHPRPALSLQ